MTSSYAMDAFWSGVTVDRQAEEAHADFVRGKVAHASLWPFLASAETLPDLRTRLALMDDRLDDLSPVVREKVTASFIEDWTTMKTEEASVARQVHEARLQKHAAHLASQIQPGQVFYDEHAKAWKYAVNQNGHIAGIDPSDALRYNHYPPPPPPNNGELQGPDGFVVGGEGEQRTPEAYATQTTPGAWTVTPGSEWPVKPNAGDATQQPRTAIHHVGGHYSLDDLKSIQSRDPDGRDTKPTALDYDAHKNWAVDRYGKDTWDHYLRGGWDQSHEASRRTAGEGVVATPGPNPNYFSQGSNSFEGPPTYPQDPGPEPLLNPMDEMYGSVPPQMSSGSDGSQNGPYSQADPSLQSPTASRRVRPFSGRHAATNGQIVGHCDSCSKPVRYHTKENGKDELRHLHNNSNDCSDGEHHAHHTAKFFDPNDPTVRTVAAIGDPEQASDGMSSGTPVGGIDQNKSSDQVTDTTPNNGMGATSMRRHADAMERPTSENPTGRGTDEFAATRWDNAVRQRPMQTAEERNINTPVQPGEPIRTLDTNGPRETQDKDESDEEGINQGQYSREAKYINTMMEMA